MSIFGYSLPAGVSALPGEEQSAMCMNIAGHEYAWDESDNVYVFTGISFDENDDGFRKVGVLEWPDDDDGYHALREWVAAHDMEIANVISVTINQFHQMKS